MSDKPSDVFVPWSEIFELSWRPSLAFFDSNVSWLRRLEAHKILRSFKVEPNEVSALTFSSTEARLSPRSCRLSSSSGSLEDQELRRLLTSAVEALNPRMTTIRVSMQQVIPMGGRPDTQDACRRAASGLFPFLGVDYSPQDFAALIDGTVSTAELEYQLEFGVVSPDEVPVRLSRAIGRMGSVVGRSDAKRGHKWTSTLTGPSVFVDSTWRSTGTAPEDDCAVWALGLRDAINREVHQLTSRIFDTLTIYQSDTLGGNVS